MSRKRALSLSPPSQFLEDAECEFDDLSVDFNNGWWENAFQDGPNVAEEVLEDAEQVW